MPRKPWPRGWRGCARRRAWGALSTITACPPTRSRAGRSRGDAVDRHVQSAPVRCGRGARDLPGGALSLVSGRESPYSPQSAQRTQRFGHGQHGFHGSDLSVLLRTASARPRLGRGQMECGHGSTRDLREPCRPAHMRGRTRLNGHTRSARKTSEGDQIGRPLSVRSRASRTRSVNPVLSVAEILCVSEVI